MKWIAKWYGAKIVPEDYIDAEILEALVTVLPEKASEAYEEGRLHVKRGKDGKIECVELER